jgi:site-specific recombinase XerD
VLASTGCRVAELCNLKTDNINTATREIRIINGKGGKDRLAFLNDVAVAALEAHLAQRHSPSPYVFYSLSAHSSEKLTNRSVERIICHYAAKAGITKPCTPHTLRHTMASSMLRKKVDLRFVQELLGHANINTTVRYTHVANEQLKEVFENAQKEPTAPGQQSQEVMDLLKGMLEEQKKIVALLQNQKERAQKSENIPDDRINTQLENILLTKAAD